MDAKGHFRKSDGGGVNKQGTVNTAIGAETNDAPEEEGGEEEEDANKLTLSATLLPAYREFLQLMVHISANIKTAASDNEQNYADDESWESNDLADLGNGFLEVIGDTHKVSQ